LNQWIAAELSHPLKKIEMGLPKKNFEKIISFPKKFVEVWVFDGTLRNPDSGITFRRQSNADPKRIRIQNTGVGSSI
jgi:hypothetical protein